MIILNMDEAAIFLGKTSAALRNGYKRWRIPHFRLGGQIKFTKEALEEFVNKSTAACEEQDFVDLPVRIDRRKNPVRGRPRKAS